MELLPSITPIANGWRVAVSDTHAIDVVSMAYNYRIVLSEKSTDYQTYSGGWCYVGKDPVTFMKTILAAIAWATEGGDEPLGWNKNIRTQEWRDNAE